MNVVLIMVLMSLTCTFILLASEFCISYATHIKMNKIASKMYIYASFEEFEKIFNTYKMDERMEYDSEKESIFLRFYDEDNKYRTRVYLHASIVQLDGLCLIFHPLDWIKYNMWKRKLFRERKNNKV